MILIFQTERMNFLEVGYEDVDSLGIEDSVRRKFDISEFIEPAGK